MAATQIIATGTVFLWNFVIARTLLLAVGLEICEALACESIKAIEDGVARRTLTRDEVLEGYRSLGEDEGLALLESMEPGQLMGGGAAIIGPDTQYVAGPCGPDDAKVTATIDAARAGFMEDDVGSLEVGKQADVTVLSRDILEVPEDEILCTEVLYTVVGGVVRYRAK